MEKPIRKTLMLFCLVAAVFLAACGGAAQPPAVATSAPTADLNALRTEVAATVMVQAAEIYAKTPSPAPTVAPSATPKPPSDATATATQQAAVVASFTPGAGTPTVTLTNQAKYISQTVADGTTFLPGTKFTMTWRIQNSGTATWTDKYVLRFFAGVAFGASSNGSILTNNELPIGREVKPGEMVDLSIDMQAPLVPGEYTSSWVMSTANRANFKDPVFLTIKVVKPTGTPTATKVPATATPTK